MKKKFEPVETVLPIEAVHHSPWGYVVVVLGNPENPNELLVCGQDDTQSTSLAPLNGIPLYSIRGKDWGECMRSYHVIQGFGPYKDF